MIHHLNSISKFQVKELCYEKRLDWSWGSSLDATPYAKVDFCFYGYVHQLAQKRNEHFLHSIESASVFFLTEVIKAHYKKHVLF